MPYSSGVEFLVSWCTVLYHHDEVFLQAWWVLEVMRLQFCIVRCIASQITTAYKNNNNKKQCQSQCWILFHILVFGCCKATWEPLVGLEHVDCNVSVLSHFISLFLIFLNKGSTMCWYGVLDWSAKQFLCWNMLSFLDSVFLYCRKAQQWWSLLSKWLFHWNRYNF